MARDPKAVVLLSGGLDSTTVLAIARDEGYACAALSFDYGQRHGVELEAAQCVARAYGVAQHVVVKIDLRQFGGSALTSSIGVPKDRELEEMADGIPITYVPARNTIFLSFALAWAETLEAADIFIGVNALDYSGYPDCRPEYIAAFEAMANLATKAGVEGRVHTRIHTPLVSLTKGEIIQRGLELGVDYALTHSCYDPDAAGMPCRRATRACCGRRVSPRQGCVTPLPRDAVSRQRDLLHLAGGGSALRPSGGVLSVRGMQPLDGPRGTPVKSGVPVLRHRLRRHRTVPAAAGSRTPMPSQRQWHGRGKGRIAPASDGTSCAPEANLCCNSIPSWWTRSTRVASRWRLRRTAPDQLQRSSIGYA